MEMILSLLHSNNVQLRREAKGCQVILPPFSGHVALAQLTPQDARKQAASPVVSDPAFSFLLLECWALLAYLQL